MSDDAPVRPPSNEMNVPILGLDPIGGDDGGEDATLDDNEDDYEPTSHDEEPPPMDDLMGFIEEDAPNAEGTTGNAQATSHGGH